MDDQINRFRERIDEIDAQVLQLISERANCAHRIGELKGGAVVYRPEREAQVLRRLREINTGPLPGDSVQHLFTEIISACRALERDMRVAYLGPRGTYSEEAVAKQFGAHAEGEPCASIAEVFQRVEAEGGMAKAVAAGWPKAMKPPTPAPRRQARRFCGQRLRPCRNPSCCRR